jgi:hypothetical protein
LSAVYSLRGEENPLRGKGFSTRCEGHILRKSKKTSGKKKKPTGETFAQADMQNAAIAAKTRHIGVKRGLMDIGF